MFTLVHPKKYYVGITSAKCNRRWRNNGIGYKKQQDFFNFKNMVGIIFVHIVILENKTICIEYKSVYKTFKI